MPIVMGMQNVIKIYQKVQGIGPVSLFFQNLNLGKTLTYPKYHLTNLIGYILSISMCMQNFITIFFTVLEIGPFSLFQNLELGKAPTDKKCHFAISWVRSCQYHCLRTFYQNIPFSLRDRVIFIFSEFGTRQSLDR